MLLVALGVAAFATQGAPPTAAGAILAGRVTLLLPPKVKIDPGGAVVFVPGLTLSGQGPARASITSRDKRFDPRVLAVSAGTKVTFPNVDSIYHNAFSLSPGNNFDMGLYRKGASRDVVLKNPGIVRVYCNIHPDMAASVVVVEGNAFALVHADGSYRIEGLPPGPHEVHIWSDLAGEQILSLAFEAGRVTDWSPVLDAANYLRVSHLNKHGKAYPKAKNDADRY
ncbi:MAG: hypothetical protein ABI565_04450 [Vicinamibacteria bacterium]